jgi:trans-2,3-dihydro-3-hydroxyanthranilate isomerase
MQIPYQTVDVFTDRIFGGNPLAVVPDGQGLTDAEMQAIAREFNYSETVFLLPPDDPGHLSRLRIFTPQEELPFAGHPTIGAAFVLTRLGRLTPDRAGGEVEATVEVSAGPLAIRVELRSDGSFFGQLTAPLPPTFTPFKVPPRLIAQSLALTEGDLAQDLDGIVWVVSCGLPFLVVPLATQARVEKASIDLPAWRELVAITGVPQVSLFAPCDDLTRADWHTRMFAPGLGVMEDPATGSAAVALGAWLARASTRVEASFDWILEQGIEIGRPSRLEVLAQKVAGAVTTLCVGGSAVAVAEGTLSLPR